MEGYQAPKEVLSVRLGCFLRDVQVKGHSGAGNLKVLFIYFLVLFVKKKNFKKQ